MSYIEILDFDIGDIVLVLAKSLIGIISYETTITDIEIVGDHFQVTLESGHPLIENGQNVLNYKPERYTTNYILIYKLDQWNKLKTTFYR